MKPLSRLAAVLGAALLTACGGATSSSSSTTSSTNTSASQNYSGGGPNVVAVTVGPGPGDDTSQTFNIPLVSVTVCEAGTSTCGTIPDVLVDTGSAGVRLMASALTQAGLSLPPMADPHGNGNTIEECLPFADGYAWGPVSTATVMLGSETSSSAIPVQIINDSSSPSPAPPSSCSSRGSPLNSVNALDANGVIGVSVFSQDCGSSCAEEGSNEVYFSCTAGGTCISTTLPPTDQVINPVAGFPTDNNGVILQLTAISSQGATTGQGYLVFGIGTENNNSLGSATVLTADEAGDISTTFNSTTLGSSFIDSGSNSLYFNDSSLSTCGSSGNQADFYCPSVTATLSATNQGSNGATSDVTFQVANLDEIDDNDFAINDVAGPATPFSGAGAYFDWGLPFFYGRTVYTAIEGKSAGGTEGPFYAY